MLRPGLFGSLEEFGHRCGLVCVWVCVFWGGVGGQCRAHHDGGNTKIPFPGRSFIIPMTLGMHALGLPGRSFVHRCLGPRSRLPARPPPTCCLLPPAPLPFSLQLLRCTAGAGAHAAGQQDVQSGPAVRCWMDSCLAAWLARASSCAASTRSRSLPLPPWVTCCPTSLPPRTLACLLAAPLQGRLQPAGAARPPGGPAHDPPPQAGRACWDSI